MNIAIYPGSFNPWHNGHTDILYKSAQIFDKIIIARGVNPEKKIEWISVSEILRSVLKTGIKKKYFEVVSFEGLLVDFAHKIKASAIIRGLRNGHDLQYEMNQQYWNEDLGLDIPIVYFICDRNNSHISSSTIRALEKFKK